MATSQTPPGTSTISAKPAKRFFVEMLTRDIELADAILDLLDNSVDGALRANAARGGALDRQRPFEGYWAHITLDKDHFVISDNCGGIPYTVARDYAFRFGRPDGDQDAGLPTVGVYGIGMKRALFKLGQDAHVRSHHADDGAFTVHINSDWLVNDSWDLEMDTQSPGPEQNGVTIEVRELHPGVKVQFDATTGKFDDYLHGKIRDHYAYLIQKGLEVKVNGIPVKPVLLQTLISAKPGEGSSIDPYIYKTEHEGVSVLVVMGMYERFPTETDLDEFAEGRRKKDTAGWTVICNDRVVVSHDTTHITGWGEAGVPSYHSQFITLAGVVLFNSTDASKLPLTTTKRGLDLSSPLYAAVKDEMRQALKHFTAFTYQWKGQTDERAAIQEKAQAIDIRAASTAIPAERWQESRKGLKGQRFVPALPKPAQEKTHSRISFEKSKRDIADIAEYMEMDTGAKPSDVGSAAFDFLLAQARA